MGWKKSVFQITVHLSQIAYTALFHRNNISWRWRWYVPPKCWLTFTSLHWIISQKTALFSILTASVNNGSFNILPISSGFLELVKKKDSGWVYTVSENVWTWIKFSTWTSFAVSSSVGKMGVKDIFGVSLLCCVLLIQVYPFLSQYTFLSKCQPRRTAAVVYYLLWTLHKQQFYQG
jgi:hypothetical protein